MVISLKEGLFTKANKIFKVSYKDGSSKVEIVKWNFHYKTFLSELTKYYTFSLVIPHKFILPF